MYIIDMDKEIIKTEGYKILQNALQFVGVNRRNRIPNRACLSLDLTWVKHNNINKSFPGISFHIITDLM
jgi:hypothetical protein